VGRNRIERAFRGCVLVESWTAADGGRGTSHNIYDRQSRTWHQTWVDDNGFHLRLDGGLRDGRMVLEGSRIGENGVRVQHRLSWTPLAGGEVRQHWERSLDGGTSWSTLFLGRYRPIPAPGRDGPGE
jgi:hypothetical protein